MRQLLTILLFIIGSTTARGGQTDQNSNNQRKIFTIYLVRHAEKDLSSNQFTNPPLTPCGKGRAEHLSDFLSSVHLDAIYSTDFTRTKNTASPTAISKGLGIQDYNSKNLEEFSTLLMSRKQDVLVVGHSNTTGVLAGLLVGENIGEFDLDIYNRVYQVVVYEESGRLHLLHTAYSCID